MAGRSIDHPALKCWNRGKRFLLGASIGATGALTITLWGDDSWDVGHDAEGYVNGTSGEVAAADVRSIAVYMSDETCVSLSGVDGAFTQLNSGGVYVESNGTQNSIYSLPMFETSIGGAGLTIVNVHDDVNHTLDGGAGALIIDIYGGSGSVTVNAGSGAAAMWASGGASGSYTLNAGSGGSVVDEENVFGATFTLNGGSGSDTLYNAGDAHSTLNGGSGTETLFGNGVLNDGGGNNSVYGGILNSTGRGWNTVYNSGTLNTSSGLSITGSGSGYNVRNVGDANFLNLDADTFGNETLTAGEDRFIGSTAPTTTGNAGHLSIQKTGDGPAVLSGQNLYDGPTTILGGTLALVGDATLGDTAIRVQSGTFAPHASVGVGTISAGTAGSGTGAGASLWLSGTAYDMADGAIGAFHLYQQDSFSSPSLTLYNATLKFDFSSSGADQLATSGSAFVGGVNTIQVTTLGSSLTLGTSYDLITASSGLNGAFVFSNGSTVESVTVGGQSYNLALVDSGTALSLRIGAIDYWMGTLGNHNWDYTTANWSRTPGGSATTFQYGDIALFNNTGYGAVAVTTPIASSGLLFNNSSSHAYTIAGANSSDVISGGGALNLSSGAGVTITGANTFSGLTTIASGATLTLGDGTTNGSIAGDIVDDGSLVFANPSAQTFAGDINGTGSLGTTSGDATLTLSGAGRYAGATTVATNSTLKAGAASALSPNSSYAVAGTLDLNGDDETIASLTGAGIVTNSLASTTAMLTVGGDNTDKTFSGSLRDTITSGGVLALDKVGHGTMTLTGWNTFSGDTMIDAGTLEVDNYIMRSAVTINDGGTLQGNGGTGLLTVNEGGNYIANAYSIGIGDGTLQHALGSLTTTGNVSQADGQNGVVWGLSPADAVFKELAGSASVSETGQLYALQGWGNIVNGALAAPAFKYNANFSYSDGMSTHNVGQAAVFDDQDGMPPDSGAYNSDYAVLQVNQLQKTNSLPVTNMAPATLSLGNLLDGVQVPGGFNPLTITSIIIASARGGDVAVHSGATWTCTYTPHLTAPATLGNPDAAPWDPYHPLGGGWGDGAGGGASFIATMTDGMENTLQVLVTLKAQHSGYQFFHAGLNWVSNPIDGHGGLMLAGGGLEHNTDAIDPAFKWFAKQLIDQPNDLVGGDLVIIANGDNSKAAEAEENATYFANMAAKAGILVNSIDCFTFGVERQVYGAGSQDYRTIGLSGDAFNVAYNTGGLGREFTDKLSFAAGVYFLGGDQWPYVQLLTTGAAGNLASAIISDKNAHDHTVVGGTSAGLAILGGYVFDGRYIRDGHDSLTSVDILTNWLTPGFMRWDTYFGRYFASISVDVLRLPLLSEFLTETHLDRDVLKYEAPNGSAHNLHAYGRLGRMLTFLGTLVYQQRDIYGEGFDDPFANAVGVQTNTILTIDGATETPGHAKVYGSGVVVFAAVGPNPDPDNVISPFPDYSTTSIDGRGFQMDILNVDIRWFKTGDQFQFSYGIVYDPAALGTEAVVDVWHGDVHLDSGNLPQLGTQ